MIRRMVATVIVASAVSASAQPYPDFLRSSQYVPVRDGTRLAVNIYRPANGTAAAAKPLPVIFAFTPYRARYKDDQGRIVETALNDQLALRSLIRAGYVVAVADIRGKGASFGMRRGFQDRTEANDGHDLIEWLAKQPFSDGMVGMVGCSYLGGTTLHTASTAPKALKAIFVGATDIDKYAFVRNGGITAQFNTRPDEPLSVDLASIPVDADADGSELKVAAGQHAYNTPMGPLWYGMPYRDSVSTFTGNAFWQEAGPYPYFKAIRNSGMATYFWGNWQDEPTSHVILEAANLNGKLLAGPGGHCASPVGFDLPGEVTRFFDHHLKGAANGIDKEPRATYWVEGLNGKGGYVRSNDLPGAVSARRSWFLDGGKSGTSHSANDGTLSARRTPEGHDSFSVNYDLPPPEYFAFWPGPMDDKGLSYTTSALDAPLKLIGYPTAHLQIVADKPDADVFVYLEQVPADGKVEVIAFGRLKLSHRKLGKAPYDVLGLPWHSGLSKEVAPLPIGNKATLDIALTPVSRIVPRGSKLRVTIAGADPRQRNLQNIKQTPPPVLTVLRGGVAGSRIDLPVAP
ncbi:MAG: CocE/NonD family hydrolase [Sphingobium sp.]|nr:CocE/NonD family hydrolase [Sphingobium sp.]